MIGAIASHYVASSGLTYSAEVLADSPAVFLTLDQSTGDFLDSSGAANDFTPGAGVVRSKAALLNDGGASVAGSGSAAIASRASLATGLGGTAQTLEAWVRIPATDVKGGIAGIGTLGSNGWAMALGNGDGNTLGKKLIYARIGLAWHDTGYTFSAGIHHVAMTRNGSTFTWFVDGTQIGTASPGAPNTATGAMTVGEAGASARISSTVDVDNVAIYPSALSGARIAAHYAAG